MATTDIKTRSTQTMQLPLYDPDAGAVTAPIAYGRYALHDILENISVATLADLTALTFAEAPSVIYVRGDSTEGDGGEDIFVRNTADLSAEVTADPLQNTYVPPDEDITGASGAWIRQIAKKYQATVTNIAALQALPAGKYQNVYVQGYTTAGDGGGGVFDWVAGDFSTEVAADPQHGIYVSQDPSTGAFIRAHNYVFDPKWFNAKVDNSSDDSPAYNGMMSVINFLGGGTVDIPPGTSIISTPYSSYAMIDLPPNLTMIGKGQDCILKVADSALGVRNFISFDNSTAPELEHVLFDNFAIDLNGDNNVRASEEDPARNNAAINVNNFQETEISRIKVLNAPGNQVFWVRGPVNTGNTIAKIHDNHIYRVANDIEGNYNGDHSSSYIQADYVYQYNNFFEKLDDTTTTETMMELHARYAYAWGNTGINYNRGMHVVADMDADMEVAKIYDNDLLVKLGAVQLWNTLGGGEIKTIDIYNNKFTANGLTNSWAGIDADSTVFETVGALRVFGNSWSNSNRIDPGIVVAGEFVEDLQVLGNSFVEIDGPAIDTKATRGNTITNNYFYNAASGSGGDAIVRVLGDANTFTFSGNTIDQSAYYSENAIWIAGAIQQGVVAGNNFYNFYNDWPVYFVGDGLSSVAFNVDIALSLKSSVAPDSDVYGSSGSRLVDFTSNKIYVRNTSGFGNSWSAESSIGPLYGSGSYDPPAIPASGVVTTTVTVSGAALGDYVESISAGVSLSGILLSGYVSAVDTVTAQYFNPTTSSIDLASHTIRVKVSKK